MYMFQDLTDRFPFKIDLERLRSELASLESSNWLSHYDKALAEGWTTIPLSTHDGSADNEESQRLGEWGKYKTTKYFDQLPYFKSLVEAFEPNPRQPEATRRFGFAANKTGLKSSTSSFTREQVS